MELGLGRLGWTPAVFWSSTLIELQAAAEGLRKMHAPPGPKAMTKTRLNELMELYPDAATDSRA